MDYKSMNINDIIDWCKANNQVEWLKAEAAKKVEYKVYPRVKGEDGKLKVDKSQPYKVEMRPISFIQIKKNFVDKFMPEIAPTKKDKKPNMFDLIASL